MAWLASLKVDSYAASPQKQTLRQEFKGKKLICEVVPRPLVGDSRSELGKRRKLMHGFTVGDWSLILLRKSQ